MKPLFIPLVVLFMLPACANAVFPDPQNSAILLKLSAILKEHQIGHMLTRKQIAEAIKTAQSAANTYNELKQFTQYRKKIMQDITHLKKLDLLDSHYLESFILNGDRLDFLIPNISKGDRKMEHGMLQDDKVLYDVVYYHLDAIIHISQILLAFSVFIYLIRAIYLNYLKGETDYVPSFLQIGFVILAISTYKFWTVELATLIIGIARRIDPGNMANIYKILANAYASFDELNFSVFKMNAFLNYVILSLCLFFFKLGTLVFEILQFFIQAIIWLLGPIAISMTLFPNFSGAFKKWFANFIAVNFWSVIYALLTVFFNQVMSREFSQFLEQGTADVTFEMHIIYINMLIYAVIFFISIACIPFYTGMIIPGQDVGAMSSMIAAGSMYATTRLFTVVKKIGFTALQGSKGIKTFGAKIASLKGKGKKTS